MSITADRSSNAGNQLMCFVHGSDSSMLIHRLMTKPFRSRAEKLNESQTSAKFFAGENALVRFFRTNALTAVFAKNAQTYDARCARRI